MDEIKIAIKITPNFASDEKEKIAKAGLLIQLVMNNQVFRDWVTNFSYSVQSCTGRLWWKTCQQVTQNQFHYTDDNNAKVLQTIVDAAETLNGVKNHVMDIDEDIYYKSGSTVGYGYGGSPWQYINRRFFGGFTASDTAGNLSHEWCHKIGYDHEFYNCAERPFSVPYAVGDKVAEMAAELEAQFDKRVWPDYSKIIVAVEQPS